MICKNCGKENAEEAKICEACGVAFAEEEEVNAVSEEIADNVAEEAVEEGNLVAEETGDECGDECCCCCEDEGETKKKGSVAKVLAVAIPAVVVVGAVVASLALGVFRSPALKAQSAYYKALVSGDGETMYKYDIDKYELKDVQSGLGVDSESEVIDIYKESFTQYPEMFAENLGGNLKTSIYVADFHKYSKDDIKKLDEHLVKYCGYTGGALQDLRVADVLVTITGDKKDQRNYMEEIVAKIDGKWYVGAVGDVYSTEVIEQILSGEFDKQQEERQKAVAESEQETGDSENEAENVPEE